MNLCVCVCVCVCLWVGKGVYAWVWLTDERRLALFPVGAIVRDLHHHESPTRCKQGSNLSRT